MENQEQSVEQSESIEQPVEQSEQPVEQSEQPIEQTEQPESVEQSEQPESVEQSEQSESVEQSEQSESVEQSIEQEQLQETYKYLQNYFLRSEIIQILSSHFDKTSVNNILDIGSFEGIGTAYFANNFLDNEHSTLTCVHGYSNEDNDIKYLQNGEEMNFDFNISNCNNSNRIIVKKITTDSFFENNSKTYNLIYIDGSRQSEFIKRDIEKSFEFLENNGIIWINNYNYSKEIYDTTLESYHDQYDIIYKECPLAIKKK